MRLASASLVFTAILTSTVSAQPTACQLVTASEMAAILGTEVGTAADDRGIQTKCTYEPAQAELGGPFAELQVNWGDGHASMAGAGAMKPQLGAVMDDLDGLGDQATSVGPMTMIRRGEDLITLVVSGVPDNTAAIKGIYKVLDERLASQ